MSLKNHKHKYKKRVQVPKRNEQNIQKNVSRKVVEKKFSVA